MNRVFVVAWEYGERIAGLPYLSGGGGGFDWYFTARDADVAFETEKANCNDPALRAENWTAARYDVDVRADPRAAPDAVTREIESQDSALFDAAPLHYPAKVSA